jgi:hypothetical protein
MAANPVPPNAVSTQPSVLSLTAIQVSQAQTFQAAVTSARTALATAQANLQTANAALLSFLSSAVTAASATAKPGRIVLSANGQFIVYQ